MQNTTGNKDKEQRQQLGCENKHLLRSSSFAKSRSFIRSHFTNEVGAPMAKIEEAM
jgi:hypothetical protein